MPSSADTSSKLDQIASSGQKDKSQPYLDLLTSLLSPAPDSPDALIIFGKHFTTSTFAIIAGRKALECYVTALAAGSGLDRKDIPGTHGATTELTETEVAHWTQLGEAAFHGDQGEVIRLQVAQGALGGSQAGANDEQVLVLRMLASHLLQREEDWEGAARALMGIPMEGTSRLMSDEDKFKIYIQIIRLLLEGQAWGQAQGYFNRASVIYPSISDKEARLSYRLSQARLFDFSAKFNEAAQKYHEVSFDTSVAEEDRLRMLQAAVTTSILAPAGPQRARTLASINRDDRVHSTLPPFLGTMLRKMLLEYIVRPEEVKEFEAGLEDHQRATVEGGGTVLERAVGEHNVGACAKVYDNISFEALGSVLNIDARAAQLIARKMVEQGRLRAWIDQPLSLLYFESRSHETDADAQGTAGGLGVEREEKPIEPVSWTERWDDRIRETSIRVESIAAAIQAKAA